MRGRRPATAVSVDQPSRSQRLDDRRDIAVRDQQRARQRAHRHARPALRSSAASTSNRGSVVANSVGEAALDAAFRSTMRAAQQPQPQPHAARPSPSSPRAFRAIASSCHASPPATAIAWPVTERAARRAQPQRPRRRPPAAAISRRCGLKRGEFRAVPRPASRPVRAAIFATAPATSSVSVKPGQTALTVIAVRRQLGGERAGQADRAVLGRDIGGGVGVALAAPAVLSDGDDPPGVGGPQVGQRRLAAMEQRVEVDRQRLRASRRRRVAAKGALSARAGIVDQDRRPDRGRRGRRRRRRRPAPRSVTSAAAPRRRRSARRARRAARPSPDQASASRPPPPSARAIAAPMPRAAAGDQGVARERRMLLMPSASRRRARGCARAGPCRRDRAAARTPRDTRLPAAARSVHIGSIRCGRRQRDEVGAAGGEDRIDVVGLVDVADRHRRAAGLVADPVGERRLEHPAIDRLGLGPGLAGRDVDQVGAGVGEGAARSRPLRPG